MSPTNPTVKQALLDKILKAAQLVGASTTSMTTSSLSYSLYEGFVFSCVVEALERLGANFEVIDHNGGRSSMLSFRTKPGMIYTPGSHYSYVLFWLGQEPEDRIYELHSNLYATGRSKVQHELDVAIIDHAKAIRYRQCSASPTPRGVKFLAECKFYVKSLPLGLGRGYLGLSSEFSIRCKSIVTSARKGDSVRMLMKTHKGTANFGVTPMEPERVDRFVSWIGEELSQIL